MDVNVQSTDDTTAPALDLFNAGEGGLSSTTRLVASWFTVYPCAGADDLVACAAANPAAFAGADGRVLLAQITADGDIYGHVQLAGFPEWRPVRLLHRGIRQPFRSAPTTWTFLDAPTLRPRTYDAHGDRRRLELHPPMHRRALALDNVTVAFMQRCKRRPHSGHRHGIPGRGRTSTSEIPTACGPELRQLRRPCFRHV